MADYTAATSIPGIAALPLTTTRQIGSGQVLVDPSSIVKELIDNALDARAKSIFVDITANTIDSIQVKDDGHGIPAEDRALVCRRYCTSKIRDLHDLKEVGGKWLGFRGEALSSMAEMSETLSVTTRVEGEAVAVKLKYGRDGELSSTERGSHPVGTTVKLARFFEYIPVRKQTATKDSSKCLAKIRRLMQAYALARPTVRFRLHVLQAKNSKSDFMYAPKASSNIEDTVFKVIGKDCALQCDWTALESDGFEIQAFLPKLTADGSKFANQGAFISVDSRPISNSRGTMKQIVIAFRERLRKSNHSLATMKDAFFSMNIICPPDSYDPNIEPAKDDVMFDNGDIVLGAVDKLLRLYYPEVVIEPEPEPGLEPPTSGPQSHEDEDEDEDEEEVEILPQETQSLRVEPLRAINEEPTPESRSDRPRWRASMYGIDEEDFGYLQESQDPVIQEEDEGRRAAEVSNPWTIARMNATIKSKTTAFNGQLLSPAKSQGDRHVPPSSPAVQATLHEILQAQPLTPQTSSSINAPMSSLDKELEQNICHLPHPTLEEDPTKIVRNAPEETTYNRSSASLPRSGVEASEQILVHARRPMLTRGLHNLSQASSGSLHSRRKQRKSDNEPSFNEEEGPDDTWFGQPMRGSQNLQSHDRPKRRTDQNTPPVPSDASSRTLFPAADRSIENYDSVRRNTDIRNFLMRKGGNGADGVARVGNHPSFTPINRPSSNSINGPSSNSINGPSFNSINGPSQAGFRPDNMTDTRDRPSSQPSFSRAMFSEPLPRSHDNRNTFEGSEHDPPSSQSRNNADQFAIYEDSFSPPPRPRPLSAGSQRPSLMPISPNKLSQSSCDMAAYFKDYEDRETTSADRYSSPTGRQEPRIPPPHELTSESRSQRRQTPDGAQRTKFPKLPLERVPHGYHIQGIILSVHVSIASMIQLSCEMDMRRNSLKWGSPTKEDAYDAFAEPVSERSVRGWVTQLDAMLHTRFEPLPGVDVQSQYHEGIQRGLDERKGDEDMEPVEIVEFRSVEHVSMAGKDVPVGPQHGDQASPIKVEDEMSDIDTENFVSFDITTIEDDDVDDDDDEAASVSEKEMIKKTDEEFGDDIDDDMLLDM